MGEKQRKLISSVGNWVEGNRFWNREHELELFSEYIKKGDNLYMIAQRRMGKTSLLKEAVNRLKDKYICLFVDFQKANDAPDAITELGFAFQPNQTLWKKMKGLFKNIYKYVDYLEIHQLKIKLRAAITDADWSIKGDQILDILASSENPVVLLLDEVPILVNRILKGENNTLTKEGKKQADAFMSWLRKNCIKYQGKIVFVVSGSIGFESVLHQAGLSATITHFTPFELKPWDKQTAIGCLQALANEKGITFNGNAEAEMIKRLGCCIPYHVQFFFKHAYEWCKNHNCTTFSRKHVKEVYENEMLSIKGHAELTHYEERLKMVLSADKFTLAVDMLTEAAVCGVLTRDVIQDFQKHYTFENENIFEVQRAILSVLEHDGYLEQTQKGYVFISKLLRDWWKRRYEHFHIPISEREK